MAAAVLAKRHEKPPFDGKVGGFIAFLTLHETYRVGQLGSKIREEWLVPGEPARRHFDR